MWWTLATLAMAGLTALDFYLDRDHRHEAREANRRSRASLAALAPAQRREVSRAVRGGRAVGDPSLAPAAVDMAGGVVAGRRGVLGWVTNVVFLVWITVPAVVTWSRGQWPAAVALSVGPVLLLGLFAVGIALRGRAEDALAANRRLLDGA